jgi:hypothetical protein
MATAYYKVLGQSNPTANVQTTLYTTPTGNSTVISTIAVCNQAATSTTFSVAVQGSGAALQSKHYINYNTPIPANDTITLTLGITMSAADILSVNAASSTVSFSAFGTEIY